MGILTLIPPNPYGINDNLAWAYAQDGAFYVAFVYNNLITTTGPSKALYKLIWRWPRSEHIKCFLWKVQKKILSDKLPMMVQRLSRFKSLQSLWR